MTIEFLKVWASLLIGLLWCPQSSVSSPDVPVEIYDLIKQLQYRDYAIDILKLLRTDAHITAKLDDNTVNIYTPVREIGMHMELMQESVRTKLDELKRLELERIRKLAEVLREKEKLGEKMLKKRIAAESTHLDMRELSKFGADDLKRFMVETQIKLSKLDELRKQRFREYEMQKRLEFDELLKRADPPLQQKIKENEAHYYGEHLQEKPIHLPMSKGHLLDVWEERDRMNRNNFNRGTFVKLHDLDGNGFLDENEVKVFLRVEVQKIRGLDSREMEEELERMREYTFNHADTNKDHMISYQEFVEYSEHMAMDDAHYWHTLRGHENQFSEMEYENYVKLHRDDVIKFIDEGLITLTESGTVQHNEPKEKRKPGQSE